MLNRSDNGDSNGGPDGDTDAKRFIRGSIDWLCLVGKNPINKDGRDLEGNPQLKGEGSGGIRDEGTGGQDGNQSDRSVDGLQSRHQGRVTTPVPTTGEPLTTGDTDVSLTKQCVGDLCRHEGFKKYAYPDPIKPLAKKYRTQPWGDRPAREIMILIGETDYSKGEPWTVGIGNTVGVTPDTIVSLTQAQSNLSNHLAKNFRELDQLVPSWKSMPFPIQTVLVNLVYNLGSLGLSKFKNTLSYLVAGNYPSAAANLEKSLWFKQVGHRATELVKRVRTCSIDPKHLVP